MSIWGSSKLFQRIPLITALVLGLYIGFILGLYLGFILGLYIGVTLGLYIGFIFQLPVSLVSMRSPLFEADGAAF